MSSDPSDSNYRKIPLLASGNYPEWEPQAVSELMRIGVYRLCTDEEIAPTKPASTRPHATPGTDATQLAENREWKEDVRVYNDYVRRCDKAIGTIRSVIATDQLQYLDGKTTPKDVWDALKDKHKDTTTGLSAFYIKYAIIHKTYEEDENMHDHLSFFQTENRKLPTAQRFDDEFLAQAMLMSLPKHDPIYDTITVSLLNATSDANKLKSADVVSRLMAEYRRKTGGDAQADSALFHSDKKPKRRTKSNKKPPSGKQCDYSSCPTTASEAEELRASYPFQSLIGTLMYAMLATRPDIAFAVGALSKFAANFGKLHWDEAMHVLRYLGGTKHYALRFDGKSDANLSSVILGYTDSDWAGDLDTRRSTGGYVFLMSGGAISWSSKLQTSPALSSTEAEYMACTRAAQEAIWLRQLLEELGFPQVAPTQLFGDNQGAIALAKNPANHPRTKHIGLRFHFIRFAISDGKVSLDYVSTNDMAADGLTKPLTGLKHERFLRLIGMDLRSSGSVRI